MSMCKPNDDIDLLVTRDHDKNKMTIDKVVARGGESTVETECCWPIASWTMSVQVYDGPIISKPKPHRRNKRMT